MDSNKILERANTWLQTPFDTTTQQEIQELISNTPKDLTDRFYKDMEFGTGGMRGIMGAGTNRINKYTLGRATQGLSNYIKKNFPDKELKVAIAYDCRHNSNTFAKIVADVFSANGIKVYLFEDLRPTPELSFAVRHLGCDAGIVLTASHNPPEYNGYKVYWNDGGQIVPPEDSAIINEVNSLDFSDINFDSNQSLISNIGKEVDKAFIEACVKNGTFDPDCDRLGIAVRDLDGNMKLLNGNQTMSVMTNYLIKQWYQEGRLNGKQFVGSTIVSTNLVSDIAQSYNVETKIGLTGFKWIAKMVREFEHQEFIGGGEESFGYMVGDFVRDKDAVTATLLACEIAIDAKNNESSFYKELLNIYIKHSFYKEHLISLVKKGADGAQEIKQMMIDLRNNPVKEIDGSKVQYVFDYLNSTQKNLLTGKTITIDIPKSNVLIYQTVEGTRLAARPSGTEPKIKFYFSVNLPLDTTENAVTVEKLLDQKIQRIIKELKLN